MDLVLFCLFVGKLSNVFMILVCRGILLNIFVSLVKLFFILWLMIVRVWMVDLWMVSVCFLVRCFMMMFCRCDLVFVLGRSVIVCRNVMIILLFLSCFCNEFMFVFRESMIVNVVIFVVFVFLFSNLGKFFWIVINFLWGCFMSISVSMVVMVLFKIFDLKFMICSSFFVGEFLLIDVMFLRVCICCLSVIEFCNRIVLKIGR